MKKVYKIIWRHVITGFIFIMPVLITFAVISKFWKKFLVMGGKVTKLLHIDTVLGPGGDAVIAVILFLLICIIAGFLVKMTLFKRMSDWLDGKLADFVPGYGDLKKETEVKIGTATVKEDVYETCMVHTDGYWKPAYLIDVDANDNATVFIPAAPVFSNGQVVVVPAGTYKKLPIDSGVLNSHLKKLGKGLPTGFYI
ncbi:hypothetical protein [Flavihumibacter petaseus]|uniref:DUF502 domain-containing protein n=1 Tax=Flavihumibacter petaseus NBRC 106054 TaxID=1220578 RepID=A0A0E9N6Q3_9BACT|nr:hypothetical protein [Flavihumibacter petaseus]GAO45478.1 hypothetical protein FPE01S_05_01730 [Flavihumibacter petaseus NBRC 106054]